MRCRDRLEVLRQQARLTLARDRSKGAGLSSTAAVLEAWESCLCHDPACEEAAAALMRLYTAQGARPEAVRTYERCRAALAELDENVQVRGHCCNHRGGGKPGPTARKLVPLYPETEASSTRRPCRQWSAAPTSSTPPGARFDRDAIVDAVETEQLAGYGGEVWLPQPPPADHPWRTMPHQGMTPHISGTSLSAHDRYVPGTRRILRVASSSPDQLVASTSSWTVAASPVPVPTPTAPATAPAVQRRRCASRRDPKPTTSVHSRSRAA